MGNILTTERTDSNNNASKPTSNLQELVHGGHNKTKSMIIDKKCFMDGLNSSESKDVNITDVVSSAVRCHVVDKPESEVKEEFWVSSMSDTCTTVHLIILLLLIIIFYYQYTQCK